MAHEATIRALSEDVSKLTQDKDNAKQAVLVDIEATITDLRANLSQLTEEKDKAEQAAYVATKQTQGLKGQQALRKRESEALKRKLDKAEEKVGELQVLVDGISPVKRKRAGSTDSRQNINNWAKEALAMIKKKAGWPAECLLPILLRMVQVEQARSEEAPVVYHDKVKAHLAKAYKDDKDLFMDLLPEGATYSMHHSGAQELANAITDHWTVTRAMEIKHLNFMSRNKYNRTRNSLGTVWSADKGHRVPAPGAWGVRIPLLPTMYAINKRKKEIRNATGWQIANNGGTVEIDVITRLRNAMNYSIKAKFFVRDEAGAITTPDSRVPIICVAGDAACMHKGMNQVASWIRHPQCAWQQPLDSTV